MNNTTTTMEDGPKTVYAVFYGCVMAVGLPLNAFSLWTLVRHHKLKSPSAVFMVNLAISDLLLVLALPWGIYFYATGTWTLGITMCALITMFFRNNIRCTCIFITFISVDRLLAVVYPLRSRHLRTSSNACRAAGIVWLLMVVGLIHETVAFSKILETCPNYTCFDLSKCPQTEYRVRRMYVQSVLVFTMLAVNVVCTALVSWTLHKRLNDSAKVNNKVNAMLIFIMNLVTFTICFLPVTVDRLFRKRTYAPLVCLASVNCCIDPLLYYFILDSFWKKNEDEDLAREQ